MPNGMGREVEYWRISKTFEIKDIERKNGNIYGRGYVSTSDVDLGGDVVEPKAFARWKSYYDANPLFCFQHNPTFPLGTVQESHIDDKGLSLDKILFVEDPFFESWIWPRLEPKDGLPGVYRQQSIGFIPVTGSYSKELKAYVHTEVFLLESSLVSIAMNPATDFELLGKDASSEDISRFALDCYRSMKFESCDQKGLSDILKKGIPMKSPPEQQELAPRCKTVFVLPDFNPEAKSITPTTKKACSCKDHPVEESEIMETSLTLQSLRHLKNVPVDKSAKFSFSKADGQALIEKGGMELYAQAHLAVDAEMDAAQREAYSYPIAKLKDGELTVYKSAVVKAKALAAGGGEDEIESAATGIFSRLEKGAGVSDKVGSAEMIKSLTSTGQSLFDFIQRVYPELEMDLESTFYSEDVGMYASSWGQCAFASCYISIPLLGDLGPDAEDSGDGVGLYKELRAAAAKHILRQSGVVLDASEATLNPLSNFDGEGEILVDQGSKWKRHPEFSKKRFLLQKGGGGLLPIGKPTDDGVRPEWKDVAGSMIRLTGARGGVLVDGETRKGLFDSLIKCYSHLEKELPEIGEIRIDEIDDAELLSANFSDFNFKSGENRIFFSQCLENDVQNIRKAFEGLADEGDLSLDSLSGGGDLSETLREGLKALKNQLSKIDLEKSVEEVAMKTVLSDDRQKAIDRAVAAIRK